MNIYLVVEDYYGEHLATHQLLGDDALMDFFDIRVNRNFDRSANFQIFALHGSVDPLPTYVPAIKAMAAKRQLAQCEPTQPNILQAGYPTHSHLLC